MTNYYERDELEFVYLEDSFVLGVEILPKSVEVGLDVVLREGHPSYAEPREGEQYCFHQGVLRFDEVSQVSLQMPAGLPAIDATGEIDYGGIDHYEIDGSVHHIVGEIGTLIVHCNQFSLKLIETH